MDPQSQSEAFEWAKLSVEALKALHVGELAVLILAYRLDQARRRPTADVPGAEPVHLDLQPAHAQSGAVLGRMVLGSAQLGSA